MQINSLLHLHILSLQEAHNISLGIEQTLPHHRLRLQVLRPPFPGKLQRKPDAIARSQSFF